MNRMDLYLVAGGDVSPATPETETDGIESVLVLATSPADALRLAMAYDRGDVAPDNVAWHGRTIVAVRDPDVRFPTSPAGGKPAAREARDGG